MRIGELMSQPATTVPLATTIRDAGRLLLGHGVVGWGRSCCKEAGTLVATWSTRMREHQVLGEHISALCAESKRTGSRFAVGALYALRWLAEGGSAP